MLEKYIFRKDVDTKHLYIQINFDQISELFLLCTDEENSYDLQVKINTNSVTFLHVPLIYITCGLILHCTFYIVILSELQIMHAVCAYYECLW